MNALVVIEPPVRSVPGTRMPMIPEAKYECRLPDKLSALIRVAIRDLEAVEADPKYTVGMSKVWHCPVAESEGVYTLCEVCLAGAVMAKSCSVSWHEAVTPGQFPVATAQRLACLDRLRLGDLASAMEMIYPLSHKRASLGLRSWRYVTPYDFEPAQFKADMLEIARDLEAEGF